MVHFVQRVSGISNTNNYINSKPLNSPHNIGTPIVALIYSHYP